MLNRTTLHVLLFICAGLSPVRGQDVLISEFMAVNNATLQDDDNDFSDWIELHNTTPATVSLDGWYLTDRDDNLTKWRIPDVDIAADGFLVIFASGKDRTNTASSLHANFSLSGGGEYLALVRPNGTTVEFAYAPSYPAQSAGVAYGITHSRVTFVAEGSPCRWLVPTTDSLGTSWVARAGFDDSVWDTGFAALGFELGEDYTESIFTDVSNQMYAANQSLYARIPFYVENEQAEVESLILRMKYDDGFVAYVNGLEAAAANAPALLSWNSQATAANADTNALIWQTFIASPAAQTIQQGQNILAVHAMNHLPDDPEPDFLMVAELEATVRNRTLLAEPTPGTTNSQGRLLSEVTCSPGRGFYTNDILVTITADSPGAQIRYTTDFTEPTTNSALYVGVIAVSNTTALRVAAFKPGYQASVGVTHTYIFPNDVLTQPANVPGFPNSWGGSYGMNASVVAGYGVAMMTNALHFLPSVSIVTATENLFDPTIGIYANPWNRGLAWERAVSAEWIKKDGTSGFQVNCGMRIRGGLGGGGRGYAKKSMRLLFKSTYGPGKLEYPIFDWDPNATKRFDSVVFRAGGNDRQDFTRDEWARRCQLDMGSPSSHGVFVHVYLNGLYWGLYNLVERPAADFSANYFGGGNKENWDAVKHNFYTAEDGDTVAAVAMINQCRAGLADNAAYERIQGRNPDRTRNPAYPHYLDVPNHIDYMLCNIYHGMGDWPGHNWAAARQRDEDSTGYKFFIWDGEGCFSNGDVTGVGDGAAEPYGRLRANAEFRQLFGDHVYRHLFNDGALTPEKGHERLSAISDGMEYGIVTEHARWGHISLDAWRNLRDQRLFNYIPQRTAGAILQLRNAGLYPWTDPPEFNREGGVFSNAFNLVIRAANDIYYTLDGRDPREYGTGASSGDLYGIPIPISYSVHVKARARSAGGEWSALQEDIFYLAAEAPLRVTEVMYNPRSPEGVETNGGVTSGDFEYIELQNTGGGFLGLTGITFTDGIDFNFTGSSVYALEPGEHVVIVKNLAAFSQRYPNWGTMNIAGEYEGSLNDAGETLRLVDGLGTEILSFTYDNARGWPLAADGAGHALVPLVFTEQPEGALDYGGHWRAGTRIHGSPGVTDPAPPSHVVLNEIMAHTDYSDPGRPEYDSNDWLELLNTSASNISLAAWYLSDDATELKKWPIPANLVIAAGARLVFDEVSGFHAPITNGFGLNKEGEQVYLSYLPGSSEDRVVDCVPFKGQDRDLSIGRYADGDVWWYAMMPTRDAANVQPTQDVIISEIMYHPQATELNPADNENDEYIEIRNQGDLSVDLWSEVGPWRIDGGVRYTFPSNTTLAADETLILVSFDPADTAALGAFLTAYGLSMGEVTILGPTSGKLSNRGERIALERSQDPDIPGDPASWIIVDEVIYFDRDPWPAETDGTGRPLQRSPGWRSGNDPANWKAGFTASPGLLPQKMVISRPEYGATLLQPSRATAEAAIDADYVVGSVSEVEFFVDGNEVGVDLTEPYEVGLSAITNEGLHTLAAIFTDGGGSYTSREVVVIASRVSIAEGATEIKSTAATLNGEISHGGRAEVTLYWGQVDAQTDKNAWEHASPIGARSGHFSGEVSGLNASGSYVYRCYVTNAYGEDWSDESGHFLTAPADVWLSLAGSPFDEDNGTATVRAHIGNPTESNVTVQLAFSGAADFGSDYTASATTMVIVAGTLTTTITLTGIDDTEAEVREPVIVAIASAANASVVAPNHVTATLISDDPRVINTGESAITENAATLEGELTYGENAAISIFWGIVDSGTNALAWQGRAQLGNRPQGAFTSRITGLLANQRYFYRCYAENAGGAHWAESSTNFLTGPPSVSIADVSILEGNSGFVDAIFSVELSTRSGTDVSVNYATSNGTALAGSDYVQNSGTRVVAAGLSSAQVIVHVIGDADNEWPGETFYVHLDQPAHGTLSDLRAVGTIRDDDVGVYLIDWRYRMKISFPGYGLAQGEALTDFPALVVFNTNLVNFAYEQFSSPGGGDLRFANSNLTALLNYEIETWNTNGASYLWVQLPRLAGTNTHIWAYWGSADEANAFPSTTNGATWSAGHAAVWHMTEPNVVDSAGNNTGTAYGNTTAPGLVGDGQYFDDDYIEIANEGNFDLYDALTVSFWMQITNGWRTDWQVLVSKEGENNRGWQFRRRANLNDLMFTVRGTSGNDDPVGFANVGDGAWHYVTGVYGDGKRTVYIDGIQDSQIVDSGLIFNSDQAVRIGAGQNGGLRHRGSMDEVRIVHDARSSNWVWAAWLNMASNDLFNAHSDVEASDLDAPSLFIVYGATNIMDTSVWLTARLVSTGSAETAVWVYWGSEDGGPSETGWEHSAAFGTVLTSPDINYSARAEGLTPNSKYYYAYKASNRHGTNWAAASFWTVGVPAVGNAGGATNLAVAAATLQGSLTNASGATVTLYWGPTDEGTVASAWAHSVPIEKVAARRSFATDLDGLLYGVRYYYRAYATNAYGEDWADTAADFLTLTPHNPAQPGLNVRLYNDIQGDNLIDPISTLFNTQEDGTTNQIADIDYVTFADQFREITDDETLTLLWEGIFAANEDGVYSFGTSSDDGSVIYLDLNRDGDFDDKIEGELIVDNKGGHGMQARVGEVTLTAGRYPIAIGYYEGGGGQGMQARWKKGSGVLFESQDFIDGTSGAFFREVPGVAIGIVNSNATDITDVSATLQATLMASGAVYHVWVDWGDDDAGPAGPWDHSTYVGSYTNVDRVSVQHALNDLSNDTTYYYSFRAENAAETALGGPSASFTTPMDIRQWAMRMRIAFPAYDHGLTLTNFPALVVLSTNIAGFSYHQLAYASGRDLRFTDPDGATLDYEIETWSTNGVSCVWVCVPELAATGSDHIWAHWGNGAAGEPAYKTNGSPWRAHYNGVWHMGENDARDSTAAGNDGTAVNNVSVEGAIGASQSFDGDGDFIDMGDKTAFNLSGDFTLSAWVRPVGTGDRAIMARWGNNYIFRLSNRRPQWHLTTWIVDDDEVPENAWSLIAAVRNDSRSPRTEKFYINGVETFSVFREEQPGTTGSLTLGAWGGGSWFNGRLDEVRISSTARSADWLWACWLNQASNNMFNAYTDLEIVNPDAPWIHILSGVSDVTSTSAWFNATLTSTGSAPTRVWVYWGNHDAGQNLNWAFTNAFGLVTQTPPLAYSHYANKLTPNTVYNYLYRAANTNGIKWASPSVSFKTLGPPLVEHGDGVMPDVGTATFSGVLTQGTTAHLFFYWGTTDGGTHRAGPQAWEHVIPMGERPEETFAFTTSNLVYGIQYYYRCYATNAFGEAWADTSIGFTTLPPQPTRGVPVRENLELWLDAGNGISIDGNGTVQTWADQSGNGNDAGPHSGTPLFMPNMINGHPVVEFRAESLRMATPLRAAQTYVVFNSGNGVVFGPDWGAPFGQENGRHWMFQPGTRQFWNDGGYDQPPVAVSQNGSVVPQNNANGSPFGLASVDQYMVLKVGQRVPQRTTYYVGRNGGWGNAYFNVAEVIAYDTPLSTSDEGKVGGYLAWKYGLHSAYPAYVPSAGVGLANTPAGSLSTNAAVLNAELLGTGSVFAVTAFWGPVDGGTNAGAWASNAVVDTYSNVGFQPLSHAVEGLAGSTEYYFTFRASNAATNMWAVPSMRFETLSRPVIGNAAGAVSAIGGATLNGELVEGGTAHVIVYLGTWDGGTNRTGPYAWQWAFHLGNRTEGAFAHMATNLFYGLPYYYRCYASNEVGEAWADASGSFLTLTPRAGDGVPVTNGIVIWFDAGDGVSTNAGNGVLGWNDRSGRGHHATLSSGAPTFTPDAINGRPAVQFRRDAGDDYMGVTGVLFTREQYIVWRSPTATFDNYGGILGNTYTRSSSYLFQSGATWFHDNQYPLAVSKNGAALAGSFDMAPVDDYMVLKVTVNNNDPSQKSHWIGRQDGNSFSMDVAEIIGFDAALSPEEADAVGGYLAWKYGIPTGYTNYLPPIAVSIANRAVTKFTDTTAQLEADLNVDGSVFDVSLYWGSSDGGMQTNAWEHSRFIGSFTNVASTSVVSQVAGLTSGSTYAFTFAARNAATNLWAAPSVLFATMAQPEAANGAGAKAETGAARVHGALTQGGRAAIRIYWGPTDGGTNAASWANALALGEILEGTSTTGTISNLLYGLRYYYRCYATNAVGEDWADASETFITQPPKSSAGGTGSLLVRINSSTDDAEERSDGTMYLDSSDLELVLDGGLQRVGICFDGVTIPEDITITNAYVQFKVDEPDSAEVALTLRAEATDSAATFGGALNDISSRALTSASTNWTPAPWPTVGIAGPDQRTPDLSPVIREVVERPGWTSGNSLAIIIDGTTITGKRTAESWNGDQAGAAALYVAWVTNGFSSVISNTAAIDVDSTAATLGAKLDATGSVFDVHVYWGPTDGETQAIAWAATALIGRVTNVLGHTVNYRAIGLKPDTNYLYTFRVSNAATNIWAAPSVPFQTPDPTADNVDSDGDGLPDAWERGALGDTNITSGGPGEDWDGDGALDEEEYTAGTQATNPASFFKMSLFNTNARIVIAFEGLQASGPGYAGRERRYDLEQTTNMMTGPWIPVPEHTNLLGQGQMIMHTNETGRASYFRGKVRLE